MSQQNIPPLQSDPDDASSPERSPVYPVLTSAPPMLDASQIFEVVLRKIGVAPQQVHLDALDQLGTSVSIIGVIQVLQIEIAEAESKQKERTT